MRRIGPGSSGGCWHDVVANERIERRCDRCRQSRRLVVSICGREAIPEEDGVPSAEDVLKNLVAGQEQVVRTAREVFTLADNATDQPTADLLTQRMQMHEKTAWMLRSMLACARATESQPCAERRVERRWDQRPNQRVTDRHHLNGSRIDTIALSIE
jgi:Ferritin-like domain